MNWVGGGPLYPVPTVCCPGGQDKPGGGGRGEFYPRAKGPWGQDTVPEIIIYISYF